jgi:hypothetical protein
VLRQQEEVMEAVRVIPENGQSGFFSAKLFGMRAKIVLVRSLLTPFHLS